MFEILLSDFLKKTLSVQYGISIVNSLVGSHWNLDYPATHIKHKQDMAMSCDLSTQAEGPVKQGPGTYPMGLHTQGTEYEHIQGKKYYLQLVCSAIT